MFRVIGIVLVGIIDCIWSFLVGFTAVFTAKMIYYNIRDRK